MELKKADTQFRQGGTHKNMGYVEKLVTKELIAHMLLPHQQKILHLAHNKTQLQVQTLKEVSLLNQLRLLKQVRLLPLIQPYNLKHRITLFPHKHVRLLQSIKHSLLQQHPTEKNCHTRGAQY